MLRALLLGSALLFTLPSFARVVCTQPSMGVLTIDQSGDACAVKWVLAPNTPQMQTFKSVNGRCTEVYDGDTYKMSAILYTQNSAVQPTIVITRGVSTDVKLVQVLITDNMSMTFNQNSQKISCQNK
jgi:hypothetical protein